MEGFFSLSFLPLFAFGLKVYFQREGDFIRDAQKKFESHQLRMPVVPERRLAQDGVVGETEVQMDRTRGGHCALPASEQVCSAITHLLPPPERLFAGLQPCLTIPALPLACENPA